MSNTNNLGFGGPLSKEWFALHRIASYLVSDGSGGLLGRGQDSLPGHEFDVLLVAFVLRQKNCIADDDQRVKTSLSLVLCTLLLVYSYELRYDT